MEGEPSECGAFGPVLDISMEGKSAISEQKKFDIPRTPPRCSSWMREQVSLR